jgi:hypothetical protein
MSYVMFNLAQSFGPQACYDSENPFGTMPHLISRLHGTAEVVLDNDKPLETLLQATINPHLI